MFESELRERNEAIWIRVGVCNWKKGLANRYKSIQHKCAESALQKDRHIDKSQEVEITRRQHEIEMNRCYLARLVDIAKTLAKCGMPFRGHNEKKDSLNRGTFLETVGLLSWWDPVFDEYNNNNY